MGKLVTFDFDDTLTVPIKDAEGYWLSGGYQPNSETIATAKEMDDRGHDIAIVTSRTRTPGSDQKIGAFITFDICVSLLFAVGLFSALLATVGPQGGQGTVRWLRCKPHRRRRSVEVRPPGEAADETEAMTAR